MGFIIAALIVLFILILLVLKISVRIKAEDELSLKLGIGIFRIPLYPAKEKTVKLRDYEIDRYRKNKKKLEEKKRKRLLKKDKKQTKKAAVKSKKAVSKVESVPEERDIMGLINKLREVAAKVVLRLGRHSNIKIRRLVIVVATDNAANTAVAYGAVCGGVACLIELFENCTNLKYTKDSQISVNPDFTATKSRAIVDIAFSLRVWQVLDIAIRGAAAYFKSEN